MSSTGLAGVVLRRTRTMRPGVFCHRVAWRVKAREAEVWMVPRGCAEVSILNKPIPPSFSSQTRKRINFDIVYEVLGFLSIPEVLDLRAGREMERIRYFASNHHNSAAQ